MNIKFTLHSMMVSYHNLYLEVLDIMGVYICDYTCLIFVYSNLNINTFGMFAFVRCITQHKCKQIIV